MQIYFVKTVLFFTIFSVVDAHNYSYVSPQYTHFNILLELIYLSLVSVNSHKTLFRIFLI